VADEPVVFTFDGAQHPATTGADGAATARPPTPRATPARCRSRSLRRGRQRASRAATPRRSPQGVAGTIGR
jgi:hypothetical protein